MHRARWSASPTASILCCADATRPCSKTNFREADMTPTPFIPSYLPETPSQTAGPYVHIGLIPEQAGFEIFDNNFSGDIAAPDVAGQRIVIEGRIFDGAGHVTKDVLVETWQANAAGRYNHPEDTQNKALDHGFRGWARTGTDFVTGLYTICTIKPGSGAGRKARQTACRLPGDRNMAAVQLCPRTVIGRTSPQSIWRSSGRLHRLRP